MRESVKIVNLQRTEKETIDRRNIQGSSLKIRDEKSRPIIAQVEACKLIFERFLKQIKKLIVLYLLSAEVSQRAGAFSSSKSDSFHSGAGLFYISLQDGLFCSGVACITLLWSQVDGPMLKR